MANRPIVESGEGFLPIPPDSLPGELKDLEGVKAAVQGMQSDIQDLYRAVNGQLSLGDDTAASRCGNLNAQRIPVVFSTADTEKVVPHGLGRVPVGYDVIRRDRACIVYDSSIGSWSNTLLYLKCDTEDAEVVIRAY